MILKKTRKNMAGCLPKKECPEKISWIKIVYFKKH